MAQHRVHQFQPQVIQFRAQFEFRRLHPLLIGAVGQRLGGGGFVLLFQVQALFRLGQQAPLLLPPLGEVFFRQLVGAVDQRRFEAAYLFRFAHSSFSSAAAPNACCTSVSTRE